MTRSDTNLNVMTAALGMQRMPEQPAIVLSAFADEAANHKTAVEQLAALAALGLRYYSPRFVDVTGSGTVERVLFILRRIGADAFGRAMDADKGPGSLFALDRDLAAMELREVSGEGQTESDAAIPPGQGLFGLLEGFHHPLDVLL